MLLRGRKVEGVTLAQKGIFKDRTIEEVTADLNVFYKTSDIALLNYISVANEAIETEVEEGAVHIAHARPGDEALQPVVDE